ncbi:MAG: hypothetical protein QF412_10890 [Planctomycetota bacterium]|jgi:hypothetical protein|nr:hypothetical protein [Planctomycetota bacterium]
MSLSAGWIVAVALAVSCGGEALSQQEVARSGIHEQVPEEKVLFRIKIGTAEVESGKGFSLTVLRGWSKGLIAEEWSDEILSPLNLHLIETIRREQEGGFTEELRHYRAHVFAPGEFILPARPFRARPRDGGAERVTFSEELKLSVSSSLLPGDSGSAEMPRQPFSSPIPWYLRWSIAVAGLLVFVLLIRSPSRRESVLSTESVTPGQLALTRLQRLRERRPQGIGDARADYIESSSVLRSYIEEEFSLCILEATTEEFLAAEQTRRELGVAQREMLADFLGHCDLVKFARHEPLLSEREKMLDVAEAFVRGAPSGDRPSRGEEP